jgi:flagellar biosynthesis protein FliQ
LNSNFEQVLPYINIGVFLSLGLAVYHLATRSKSILSSTLLLVVSLYSSSIQIILANSDIFNTIIIEGYDLSFIPKIFQVLMYIAGIGTAIGAITNYIKLLIKLDH